MEIRKHPKLTNVYISGPLESPRLYTKNLIISNRVYGERLLSQKGIEYREWDPSRSKLAALILENPSLNLFSKDLNCLYLGASSGTTVSHLSDILNEGIIYGVEFAERSIRQLIQNTASRVNVIPILGDARYPISYAKSIFSQIDLIYQDVAQPNQAEIAINNCDYYLKPGGILILAIKSQSIDSIAKSAKVYEREKKTLQEADYEVVDFLNIHRHAANHIVIIAKRKAT